jgi:hypothetical protein
MNSPPGGPPGRQEEVKASKERRWLSTERLSTARNPDGRHGIGQIQREVPTLVGFDQRYQNVEPLLRLRDLHLLASPGAAHEEVGLRG